MKPIHVTIALVLFVGVSSFQTVQLLTFTKKIQDANIGVGVAKTTINLTDEGGSAPAMVGGC